LKSLEVQVQVRLAEPTRCDGQLDASVAQLRQPRCLVSGRAGLPLLIVRSAGRAARPAPDARPPTQTEAGDVLDAASLLVIGG
jgi:hypothetical protein